MKNTWIVFGLSLFSLSAWAQMDLDDIIFYGGIAGGGAYHAAEINRVATNFVSNDMVGPVSESALPYSGDINEFVGVSQLQIGTGMRFDFLYLGLEVLGQVSNGDFGSANGEFDLVGLPGSEFPTSEFMFDTFVEMKDFEPAVDFKPGVFLSDHTLLYGRIGAAWNEATLTDHPDYNLINGGVVVDQSMSSSEDVVALRLGLGVEHRIYKQFTVFMDYTYTNYGDVSLENTNDVSGILNPGNFPLDFAITHDIEAGDMTKQVVMLGVNYYL